MSGTDGSYCKGCGQEMQSALPCARCYEFPALEVMEEDAETSAFLAAGVVLPIDAVVNRRLYRKADVLVAGGGVTEVRWIEVKPCAE